MKTLMPGMFIAIQGEPVWVEEGLRAGFLLCSDSKSYALFRTDGESDTAEFVRLCTPLEKKLLKKIVYHYKAVFKIRTKTNKGDDCLLFVAR